MKIHELPERLGITGVEIAKRAGKSPQSLTPYFSGDRDKESAFVRDIADGLGVNYERIFFCNYFPNEQNTGNDPDSAAYWLSLAVEAVIQAERCGYPIANAVVLRNLITQYPDALGVLSIVSAPRREYQALSALYRTYDQSERESEVGYDCIRRMAELRKMF